MLVASEPRLVEGLLLLSYPLHPPGRPTQLRTQHFSDVRTPTLFVSGTRDSFGTVEELKSAIKLIPKRTRLVEIAGAAHGLSEKKLQNIIVTTVTSSFIEFFSS